MSTEKNFVRLLLEDMVILRLIRTSRDGWSRETCKKQILREIIEHARDKWHLEIKDYWG